MGEVETAQDSVLAVHQVEKAPSGKTQLDALNREKPRLSERRAGVYFWEIIVKNLKNILTFITIYGNI